MISIIQFGSVRSRFRLNITKRFSHRKDGYPKPLKKKGSHIESNERQRKALTQERQLRDRRQKRNTKILSIILGDHKNRFYGTEF